MGGIKSLIRRFEALNTDTLLKDSFEETKEEFLEYNREQLLEGKTSTGADLAPTYLNDPYFKTREAAQRYSDWKDAITPHPRRKKGVPNLFIIGTYHASLDAVVSAESLSITSSFASEADIVRKYTDSIYGLGGPFKAEYIHQYLKPLTIRKIKAFVFSPSN